MDLYPAIDLRDGGAVRLAQGDFDRQSDYGDPIDLARRFADAGAPWLHVVDLDGARTGEPRNRDTVLAIAGAVAVPVQTGGAVRSADDVEELLDGGVARVVLGTAAVEDPASVAALASAFPGRVAVGIDFRRTGDGRTEVASRGWERGSGRTVAELLDAWADVPLAAVVVTSIERDGMLGGPDLEGLREVLGATALPIVASGGVASVADVDALASLSVDVPGSGRTPRRLLGAITGRALVDGHLTVEEGVAACARYG
jgi:phosphoribosylformimino-5-aminoimidazole carboxamide ribotide isomerase